MEDTVKVEALSETEYKVSINVPSEVVDKKFDEFFNSIKNQVQVPGFRKGKAPVQRIKQFFGQKARPSVTQMIIGEYYAKALKDSEINPVGNPIVSDMKTGDEYPGKFGFDNSYSVDFTVEVLPKLDPIGYDNLQLDFPQHDEEELFNAMMSKYQEQFAEKRQITDRGAKFGDSLVMDFIGYVDGKPFDGGAAQGFSVDNLGKGNFIPGFEDQIVGMKAGENKNIVVTFPKEYRASHLAGKEAKFAITVHSIVETKLAEVNEDLAMMVGYESVEELENHVRAETSKERRLHDRFLLDGQITAKLLELNSFEAPKSMVEKEMLRMLGKNKLQNLPQQGRDALLEAAEKNVKRAIILDAIYEKEEAIEVTPEELNKLLNEHAAKNNMSKDELVSNLYNSGQMDNFMGVLKTSSTIDFIIDHANQESEEEDVDRSNKAISNRV